MNKIGLNEDTLDKTTRLYIDEQDKRIAQLEEEIAILHDAGGIDAKDRDHLREVIQERNQKIDELTKRVEHEASKFAVAFAAKCKAEHDRAELEKENQLLKAEVKLWKAASENNSYKAFQLQKENEELEAENEANENGAKKYAEFYFESDKQLTKAKEIIKYLCGMVRELNKPNVQLTNVDYSLSEAELFLNSEVEK